MGRSAKGKSEMLLPEMSSAASREGGFGRFPVLVFSFVPTALDVQMCVGTQADAIYLLRTVQYLTSVAGFVGAITGGWPYHSHLIGDLERDQQSPSIGQKLRSAGIDKGGGRGAGGRGGGVAC